MASIQLSERETTLMRAVMAHAEITVCPLHPFLLDSMIHSSSVSSHPRHVPNDLTLNTTHQLPSTVPMPLISSSSHSPFPAIPYLSSLYLALPDRFNPTHLPHLSTTPN